MGGPLIRETLIFEQADGMEVPAFLIRPDSNQARPGLLVIPGHSQGIISTAGLFMDYQNAMALKLAEAGYIVLTMEVRGFGYLHPDNSADAIEHNAYTGYCLIFGTTRLGMTVSDSVAGLNYLRKRPDVVPDRIGVVGFSSGCDAAIYLGALETRVNTIVADSCVCSHESNFRFSRNDPYEAVPDLAKWLEMSDCLGLLSPRPVLVHWGQTDNDPATRSAAFNPTSLPIFKAAKRIYAAEGQSDQLEMAISPEAGHEFDVDAAIDFLRRRLPIAADSPSPIPG
jgi:dienelactone hydrolase